MSASTFAVIVFIAVGLGFGGYSLVFAPMKETMRETAVFGWNVLMPAGLLQRGSGKNDSPC